MVAIIKHNLVIQKDQVRGITPILSPSLSPSRQGREGKLTLTCALYKTRKHNKGFSLIELMISVLLSSIVLTGIYTAYRSQVTSQVTQERVVDMQQNIRNAMYYMKNSLRMAGYDPTGSANAIFVTNFDDVAVFHASHSGQVTTTDANNIAFTVDEDQDGRIDHCTTADAPCAGIDDNIDNELIAYRLNANNLQMYRGSDNSWVTMAENIDALDFVYLGDLDGTPPLDPLPAPLDLTAIRSLQISLVARTIANPLSQGSLDTRTYRNQQGTGIFGPAGDNFRRNYLTAQVNCRNLGL